MRNNGRFKRGQSGNPAGRPPIILPELQHVINANRNAVKSLILEKLEGKVGSWVDSIIEIGQNEGDINRLKTLVELALGKMIEDPPEFPVSEEEKALIEEWRRRKAARDEA